jgi:hypothetical protein
MLRLELIDDIIESHKGVPVHCGSNQVSNAVWERWAFPDTYVSVRTCKAMLDPPGQGSRTDLMHRGYLPKAFDKVAVVDDCLGAGDEIVHC